MFNINVDVFIYNSPLYPPRWERTSPVPQLTDNVTGSYSDGSVTDIYLYHAEFSHYDILIPKSSSLAKYGPLSYQLETMRNLRQENNLLPITPAANKVSKMSDKGEVSPLVFLPCPRGPGRPKRRREGAPNLKTKSKQHSMESSEAEEPV